MSNRSRRDAPCHCYHPPDCLRICSGPLQNPRIADALARWTAVVERETSRVVSPEVRELVVRNLQHWDGELMPLSRSWVDSEVTMLTGQDWAIARLALVLSKAPYQVDEALV